ncbi:MAG: tetratricopeptide repeat protein [Pedobacter sp.]|nr:MAG: tetratricopeptide repeat protein [Pedobacter sp.]
MKKRSIFLILFAFFCLTVKAQTTINSAWEIFFKNDRTTARNLFTDLSKNPATANEALLSLSLMAELDQSGTQAFGYINDFYKNSPNPEYYLAALWGSFALNNSLTKSPKEIELYNALLKRDFDGSLLAMANSKIGAHYESIKKYTLADQAYNKIGSLDDWAITGEFENISTSGFDKTYDVLNKPQADAIFTGKKGLTFGWRKVPYFKHNKWFDYSFYSNYSNSILFAQNFVLAPEDVNAQLRIGVSGSVKVWVNDQLLISEADERNIDLDFYISTLKLKKGYNRILVQIGESYADRSNFLLRLTDDKGKPLEGLKTTTDFQPYEKETTFKPERIKPAAITFFDGELKKQPNDYLTKILLAKLYLRSDNAFEARKILEPIKEKFEASTFLNNLYIDLLSLEDNRTGVETLQETIKTVDPESAYALSLTYIDFINQSDYTNAENIVKKLEAIYGENENILQKKMQLAGKQQREDEVVKLTEKAFALYPNSSSLVWIKYLIEKEVKKNGQAINYLKKFVEEHDDYNVSKQLAKAYFDKGDMNAGLNVLQQEINNDPISVGIYRDLAAEYYNQQQYSKAEKLYLQCLEIAPNISSYYESLGKIYEMSKQKDKAIAAYQRSLQLNPNNYDAIQYLRKIQDKKDVFDYFVQPDVKAMVAKAPKLADHPDDHSVILTEEVQKVVYEYGGSEEKHFYVAKILTQKGLEQLKEYDIPYYNSQNLNVEIAEVIKANGNKVPAEQNDSKIVFTNLEVGDIINLRYKIQNFNEGSLAAHFWDSFYFTHGTAYVDTKFSLLIHKNKKFNSSFSLKPIEVVKTAADEFDLYVWKNENQKALIYEDKMPAAPDVANILYLSSIPDWQFVSNWYNNIATAKARSSYEIKTVINDLFKGKKGLSDIEKVKLIYSYITQNISYSSVSFRQSGIVPQNPATVINTRIGDCKDVSTLFLAMCKEAGINAELALVNTRDNGQNTMLLPSIDFNHCIAKAIVNGKSYYVELTSNTLPFGSFYNSSLGSKILEINQKSTGVISLNPELRAKNNSSYTTNISVKGNDMVISENNYATGAVAAMVRQSYNGLSVKDQLKKMKEDLTLSYPENEALVVKFNNLDPKISTSDTLRAYSEYSLHKMFKPVAGMSIFSLPWSFAYKANQLQVTQPRYFGIDLTQLYVGEDIIEEITLVLPEGKKIVEVLKPLNISNEFLDFSLSSKLLANKLIVTRKFLLKKDFVPAEKVQAFKDAFVQMADADEQQLAMK